MSAIVSVCVTPCSRQSLQYSVHGEYSLVLHYCNVARFGAEVISPVSHLSQSFVRTENIENR